MRRPDSVDAHVGSRVRQQRLVLGMSQHELAKKLGLTFQQVQKYERGANRIGAGRLYKLSKILGVPITYFYADMEGSEDATREMGALEDAMPSTPNSMRREVLELLRSYYDINDENIRTSVRNFLKSLADENRKSV